MKSFVKVDILMNCIFKSVSEGLNFRAQSFTSFKANICQDMVIRCVLHLVNRCPIGTGTFP